MWNNKGFRARTTALSLGLLFAACSGQTVDLGGDEQGLDEGGPACPAGVASGTFYVSTQSALEQLEGCREIRGSLFIGRFAADLRALSALRVVTDELHIGALPYSDLQTTMPDIVLVNDEFGAEDERYRFPSLAGLGSLDTVRTLGLTGIDVRDLGDLASVRSIDDRLQIIDAPFLTDLSGLEGATVHGLRVASAPELVTLSSFALPADHQLEVLTLDAVPKLTEIAAFGGVELVHEPISLTNTGLAELGPFSQLISAEGGIGIAGNAELVDITALDRLALAPSLVLEDNAKLERLPEFSELRRLGVFIVRGNGALRELAPEMPGLVAEEDGDTQVFTTEWRLFQVQDNAALERVVLPGDASFLTKMFVARNGQLRELDTGGLRYLDTLSITDNPSLSSLIVRRIRTIDELTVTGNPGISLEPFARVQTFIVRADDKAAEAAP
jgi:hypothetical protein